MKTIRAATTICAVSEIAGLFLPVGCQGGRLVCRGRGFKTMGSTGNGARTKTEGGEPDRPTEAAHLSQLMTNRRGTHRVPIITRKPVSVRRSESAWFSIGDNRTSHFSRLVPASPNSPAYFPPARHSGAAKVRFIAGRNML
jgi:hypothetical protein